MADDFVRIEVGLDGGQILSALVTPGERRGARCVRSARRRQVATVELQAEDGVLLLVLSRVLYAKRFARETRVGFGV